MMIIYNNTPIKRDKFCLNQYHFLNNFIFEKIMHFIIGKDLKFI